jgi:hypothetical protein
MCNGESSNKSSVRETAPPAGVAQRMGLPRGAQVSEITRVRYLNQSPVSLDTSHFSLPLGRRLAQQRIEEARRAIEALQDAEQTLTELLAWAEYADSEDESEPEEPDDSVPIEEVKAEQRWVASGIASGPVAPREMAWDAAAADTALRSWAGGEDEMDWGKYSQGFLLRDAGNPDQFGSYKLPYCTVIDGELTIVPRGVFALAGGRGVNAVTGIDDDLRQTLRNKVTALYGHVASELEADDITSPFETEGKEGKGMPVTDTTLRTATPAHPCEYKQMPAYDEMVGDRTVVGFPSIMGNVDDGGDVVMAGAFKKTLAERGDRLRWLWQHNFMEPPIATILEVAQVDRAGLPKKVRDLGPEAPGGLLVKPFFVTFPEGLIKFKNFHDNLLKQLIQHSGCQTEHA